MYSKESRSVTTGHHGARYQPITANHTPPPGQTELNKTLNMWGFEAYIPLTNDRQQSSQR
jgi:hypothetical protein